MKSERDSYVDIAKGLCMLLIICIHTEVFGVIGMKLTFIAVPMFFFMSGFYDRSEKPWREWLLKTIKALFIPAFIWLVLSNVYLEILGFIKTREAQPYHFDYINPQSGNGPVWFLIALVYTKCLNGLLVRLCRIQTLAFVVSLCIGYIGSSYQMPMCLDEGLAALPLYYGGKLCYPHLKNLAADWRVFAGGTALLGTYLFTHYYYNIGPSNHLYNPCYLLAIAGVFPVFILILSISQFLVKLYFLESIGRHTLGIMLVHAPMCHTAAVVLNRAFFVGSSAWIFSFLV